MISRARLKKELISTLIMVALGGLMFVGIQHFKQYDGKKAFEATGLTALTFEQAKLKAAQENKPILADMSAFWCSYCKQLDRDVLANPKVKAAIEANYIFARIDSESPDIQHFQQAFNAYSYPSVFILNADGSLIKKLSITYEPEAFLRQIK
ncbi:MAG: thioredoxin family protein [Marinagarivorans sp.]|nr:thioredoxin family protein [Marinagarivorans sp.]